MNDQPYRIARDGKELGSFCERDVRAGLVNGIFRGQDNYWRAGMTEWGRLIDVFPYLCLPKGQRAVTSGINSTQADANAAATSGLGGCAKFSLIFGSFALLLVLIASLRSRSSEVPAHPQAVRVMQSQVAASQSVPTVATPDQLMEQQEQEARAESARILADLRKELEECSARIGVYSAAVRAAGELDSDTPASVVRSNANQMLEKERVLYRALSLAVESEERCVREARAINFAKWGLELVRRREKEPMVAVAAVKADLDALSAKIRQEHDVREAATGWKLIEAAKSSFDAGAARSVQREPDVSFKEYVLYADSFLAARHVPPPPYQPVDADADAKARRFAHVAVAARMVNVSTTQVWGTNLARANSGETLYCHAWGEFESTDATGRAVSGKWSAILVGRPYIAPNTLQTYRPSHASVDENWKSYVVVWDVKPKGK